ADVVLEGVDRIPRPLLWRMGDHVEKRAFDVGRISIGYDAFVREPGVPLPDLVNRSPRIPRVGVPGGDPEHAWLVRAEHERWSRLLHCRRAIRRLLEGVKGA